MRNLIFTVILFMGSEAMAHGSLELIECHNSDNSMVFRGEAQNKKNVFEFSALKAGKSVWKKGGVKLALTDTFEKGQLIENIRFPTDKTGSAHLKIEEVAAREIRGGNGTVNVPGVKFSGNFRCYAVY